MISSHKYAKEAIGVFISTYLFFLLFLTRNFSGPHDSITYLNGILGHGPLTNQHHLLYHYANYIWYHCWHFILPAVSDFYIVESFSALWGSAGLVVVYLFFRNRFHFAVWHAIAAVLVVTFSYGYWFYSINIEVYTPPMFFVLSCLYLLSEEHIPKKHWYLIFVFHSFAILFHQVNILLLPVIVIRLWQKRKERNWIAWMIRYSAIGILLVGTTYFLAGWFVEKKNTPEKFGNWILGYTKENDYWEPLTAKTPLNASFGLGHAFIGGHFIFQLEPVKKIFSSSLSGHSLDDEIFIARNIHPAAALFLTVICIVQFLIMGLLTFQFIRHFKKINTLFPNEVFLLLVTFFIYSGFFIFWVAENLEFWILQTVLFWLLVIGTLRPFSFPFLTTVRLTALLASIIFCINYFGSIKWMQHFENDIFYKKVSTLQQIAVKGDFVILQDKWIMEGFVDYFTTLEVEGVPENDSCRILLDKKIHTTLEGHHRIVLLPEKGVAQAVSRDSRYLDSLRARFTGRIRMVNKELPEIWVIE